MENNIIPEDQIELIKFTKKCIDNGSNSKDLLNKLHDTLVEKNFLELGHEIAKYFLTKFPNSIDMEYKLSILLLKKGLLDDDIKELNEILIRNGKLLLHNKDFKESIFKSLINWIIKKRKSYNLTEIRNASIFVIENYKNKSPLPESFYISTMRVFLCLMKKRNLFLY